MPCGLVVATTSRCRWRILMERSGRSLSWPSAPRHVTQSRSLDQCGQTAPLMVCDIDDLTHWGRVTHICVSELTIIGSDNGLSPGRRQAIIWNNAGLLLIEPLGTNLSEISIGLQTFSFKKMHLNMSSAKWRPFCLRLNVLTQNCSVSSTVAMEILQSYTKPSVLVGEVLPAMFSSHSLLFNTLRPGQNGWHFTDNIFKSNLLTKNIWISIRISLKFVPKGQSNNIPALARIWLGADQATSRYLYQWW